MKPLAECLELIQGKSLDEFTRDNPHPVLIGLGVIGGELQKNPAKAAGTMFLNLGSVAEGGDNDTLVNQVFNIAKQSYDVPPDGVYLGSGPENDITIPDSSISKQHAHFLTTAEGCMVVDHGSTNGSFLNGLRIDPQAPTPVRGGDILTVGRFSFTYYDALSFAKLLAVQAMAKQRSRPTPRTPRMPLGQPNPVRTTGQGSSRNGAAAPEPWAQQPGPQQPQQPQQPVSRPVMQRPEPVQPWTPPPGPGPTQGDWQQRATGRIPQGGVGNSIGTGGYPQQGYPQGQQARSPQQAAPQLPAQPVPTSWFGRLMLRLSNWLRRLAGG